MDIVELFKSWAEENEWEFRYAPNSILNFTDAWRPTVDDSLYFLLLPVERTPVINEMGVVELMNYTVSAMLVKKSDLDSGTHPEEGTDYYYEKYTENISPIYLALIGAISGFTCGEVTFSDVNIREVVNLFDTNLDGVFFTGSLTGVDITEDLDIVQFQQSGNILSGWIPILAVVSDGERRVLQIVAWYGGFGEEPVSGKYIGAVGYVDDVADGVDIRGEQGEQGDGGGSCGCYLGGTGVPDNGTGEDSDFYIDSDTGILYEKTAGAWSVFYEPTDPTVTGADNALHLEYGEVHLGGALIENTAIDAGAFDYQVNGVPEVGKTTSFQSSQDLFGLLALVGNAINGQGFKYGLTYDINGDPESWLFVKTSNDTALPGGNRNAAIGYINLATSEETFFESTDAGLRAVTSNGGFYSGISIDRVTEVIEVLINGATSGQIDSSGWTINNLAGVGDRLAYAAASGHLGAKTATQATAMLDTMVGDGGVGGTKGLVPAPAAGDAAALKFLKADGTWATASSSASSVRSLSTISANISSSSATRWVLHKTTTIPANTLALSDIFHTISGMYKNASASDVQYWVALTNFNTLFDATGVVPFNATPGSGQKWILLSRGLEVISFAQGTDNHYSSMTGSTWFVVPSTNIYHPYQAAAPGTLIPGVNYNGLPFDFTQTLYIMWLTGSTNAARVRGYDYGLVNVYRP